MSSHNIGFYEEISNIIIKYHQIRILSPLLNTAIDWSLNYFNFNGSTDERHSTPCTKKAKKELS